MNKEDMIRMAQEAQMPFYWRTGEITYLDKLQHFAKLIAQHEREACWHDISIVLLGSDRELTKRVFKAIRARSKE